MPRKLSVLYAGVTLFFAGAVSPFLFFVGTASAAACTAPATDYGSATTSVTIPADGTYRIWSRIMAPDATNNSYLLEIDGNTCYTVGDSAITANTWTWVNYQNGNTGSVMSQNLTAGSHSIKMIGREPNVELDRIIFTTDTSCTPTGVGDNCTPATDTTPPTASITAPTNGATVSGTTNINVNASDNSGGSGMAKVEFYIDGTLANTDTSSAYSYAWNTTAVANGSHTITVKAYDVAGNISSPVSVQVTTNNTTPSVTIPFRLNAGATANYTDSANNVWLPDQYAVGGDIDNQAAGHAIAGTSDAPLYQNEHWGMSAYNIPVANGTYTLKLHFAEISPDAQGVGKRVMTVKAEGQNLLTNFDIFSDVGGYKADIKQFTVTVNDGVLSLGFTSTADDPQISALEILSNAPTLKPGDVNGDGNIDAQDLSILASNYGKNGMTRAKGDLNNDGVVNGIDLSILAVNWGK